jgi:hypothetical protein
MSSGSPNSTWPRCGTGARISASSDPPTTRVLARFTLGLLPNVAPTDAHWAVSDKLAGRNRISDPNGRNELG